MFVGVASRLAQTTRIRTYNSSVDSDAWYSNAHLNVHTCTQRQRVASLPACRRAHPQQRSQLACKRVPRSAAVAAARQWRHRRTSTPTDLCTSSRHTCCSTPTTQCATCAVVAALPALSVRVAMHASQPDHQHQHTSWSSLGHTTSALMQEGRPAAAAAAQRHRPAIAARARVLRGVPPTCACRSTGSPGAMRRLRWHVSRASPSFSAWAMPPATGALLHGARGVPGGGHTPSPTLRARE